MASVNERIMALAGASSGAWARAVHLAGTMAAAWAAYMVGVVVYRLWFHPLAKVPGPKLMAVSDLVYTTLNYISGTYVPRYMRQLHRKYGKIVRTGPNRVSLDGSVGWPEVYAHRPGVPEFLKSPGHFFPDDNKVIINAQPREEHRRHRRALAHAFSEAAIYEQEPIISHYIDLFIKRLSENAKKGPIDMLCWLHFVAFDIISDLALGESFHSLETGGYHPFIAAQFSSVRALSVVRFFSMGPAILRPLAAFYTPYLKANQKHRQFVVDRAKARIAQGPEPLRPDYVGGKQTVRRDFITYLMRANDDKQPGLTEDELLPTSWLLLLAGSETTASALSTFLFEMSLPRNRKYLEAATAEVRARFTREADVDLRSVQADSLPILHACIEEALRLQPPAPETAPRVSYGAVVAGYYIPKGTRMSVPALVAHYNPENFLEPESFRPERFLPPGHPMHEPRFREHDNISNAFKPFSTGPRDCIGKNLGYTEMRMVGARILLRFDISLAEGTGEDWIERMHVYGLWERSPLMLKLKERTDLSLKD